MPDLESKRIFQRVREFEWNQPLTMYGCNKIYCEMLGNYFSHHYRQLGGGDAGDARLSLACVFPD